MAPANHYLLWVTAGPSYDPSTHITVPVNSDEPLEVDNDRISLQLWVKILNYRGLPPRSPRSSSYFSHPAHLKDRYSIAFSFVPKKSIPANDLVFGNDFDRPIRDRLPPGFGTAFRIAKWMIDPGLDGDPFADKPYLYGPALSSINTWRVGERIADDCGADWKELADLQSNVVLEGGDGSGEDLRAMAGMPVTSDRRKKWALDEDNRRKFEFEEGRLYKADFFNPYLDFSEFSLRLPGFSISVIKYIDEKSHMLRYVLKNKTTGEVYFVVVFTLLFGEELEQVKAGFEKDEQSLLEEVYIEESANEGLNDEDSVAESVGEGEVGTTSEDERGVMSLKGKANRPLFHSTLQQRQAVEPSGPTEDDLD